MLAVVLIAFTQRSEIVIWNSAKVSSSICSLYLGSLRPMLNAFGMRSLHDANRSGNFSRLGTEIWMRCAASASCWLAATLVLSQPKLQLQPLPPGCHLHTVPSDNRRTMGAVSFSAIVHTRPRFGRAQQPRRKDRLTVVI